MKIKILIVLLMPIINSFGQGFIGSLKFDLVQYQIIDKIQTKTSSTLKPQFEAFEAKKVAINIAIMGGYEFRMYRFNDDMSIGLSLNLGLGYGSQNVGTFTESEALSKGFLMSFPEYVMLYYGSNATEDSYKTHGIALGFGYEYTYAPVSYHSPSIALEYCYDKNYSIRLSYNLLKYKYYTQMQLYDSYELREVLNIRNISLTYINYF
jgi:hypothetical protein